MNRPRFAAHAVRACRLVVGIAGLPVALGAQLPPSQPLQPPTQPLPTQPAPTPLDPTQLLVQSPQVPLQPTRPEDILEQQLVGLTKPLECGPAPDGWAEMLKLPRGTQPVDVALQQISPSAAVVSWRGAPWATKHEVRWVDDPSGPTGPSLYCMMQWGFPIEGLEETSGDAVTRVAEGVVVTETRSLSIEAAPAPAPAPAPALVTMQDTVYPSCAGRTYRYTVMAFYADSAPAQNPTIVSFTTAPGPPPPALPRLTARGETMGAMLTWGALPRVFEYRIYRDGQRVGAVLGKQDVATKYWLWPETTYVDQVPAAGVYSYRVEALLSPCEYAAGPTGEALAVSSTVAAKARPEPVWGFADTHTHQFANLAFGGLLVWGQPYGPVEKALAWDTPAHGPGGVLDVVGHKVRQRNHHPAVGALPGHLVGGFPQFDGWPTYDTYTHQQYYQDWLKRAVDGGLRLMVMYAVNAEALCKIHQRRAYGRTCDDMEAVDAQIDAAKGMQRYIDSVAGGPGKGWYRIVYSAEEARQAITAGKLAVVVGIEVQSLFNCQPGRVSCTTEYVQTKLDQYWAKGVRQILAIHNTNNLFGGTAIFRDQYNANNYSLTGSWFSAEACRGSVIEFHLGEPELVEKALITLIHKDVPDAVPDYPAGGNCNAQGLTPLGQDFFRMLMHRKMIIDIDHLSQRSFNEVVALTRERNYPVISSHTGLVHVSLGRKRTEFWKTETQLAQIQGSGGLIGILLHQGRTNEVRTISKVPHDCGNSSKTWSQVYLETVRLTGGAPVALASDFGGFVPGLAPRFGTNACDRDGNYTGQLNRVIYPFSGHGNSVQFQRSAVGQRVFDYNTDGMAHIGMLPDFMEDLKKIGLTATDLQPLFRSADAYLRMWERIEETAAPPLP